MANRYWVGGSGTWSSTNTTNWSATSGGAGGASVPTSADAVIINSLSGSPVITTDYNVTVASVQINAAATLSLGGTLGCSGAIDITQGTFTTNNFNVTAGSLSSFTPTAATINLGSSTVTLTSALLTVYFISTAGLTFNAGTSTIVLSASGAGINCPDGKTFYNVSLTNTTVGGTSNFYGPNTFNNLTITGPSSIGITQIAFDSPNTINGTLSTTGTAGNRRILIRGDYYSISQTLTINSAPSLTDVDFRDIYVVGTAAPISGTRIGNRGGCSGITFSTPKTVYWATAAGGNWSGTNWATSAGGVVSNDNFPLPQDTATFVNTGLNTSATVTVDTLMAPTSLAMAGVDMSARTAAMTLATGTVSPIIFGNWKNGSGTTLSGTGTLTFGGRTTQTIASAGKSFTQAITIDTYGGTVQLADALVNSNAFSLTITNGTFDTAGFAVTFGAISSNNSNVRSIYLRNSTITLNGTGTSLDLATTTGLTFNAGTSTINVGPDSGANTKTINAGTTGLTFWNVRMEGAVGSTPSFIYGPCTFNNLTLVARTTGAATYGYSFNANQTINGTLTCSGNSAVQRVFLTSATVGTAVTLTANSIVATDCDFRDITIAGAAAGSSPTRAGDCGNNSGVVFPASKTVYWNLAGTVNWSDAGWATSSGGTPALNNFPLAQDTAVFDNASTVTGTITIDRSWNIGTFNASTRTSAMNIGLNINSAANFYVYGNWLFGTGVTVVSSTIGAIVFSKKGTQTITSNGVVFNAYVTVNNPSAYVQLADAISLSSTSTLTLTAGTFDAVSYNVTTGLFNFGGSTPGVLKMGSGLWTLTGTGNVWGVGSAKTNIVYAGTANILLSNNTTTARTFTSTGKYYNKITIGGNTSTSTTTFTTTGTANFIAELASTKTVAHTIAFGTNSQTFGKWTVTGSAGNVVTLTGTATHVLWGPRTTGIDYLAAGTIAFSTSSTAEFYAGANSTGTGANVIKTAAPAPVTRYWVGGTGTWDATTTTKWSATSGGAGGASVPTSVDTVIFNSASSASAYTVTCTATLLRCGSLTISGPASGNVTWAGTAPLHISGNITLPVTGLTRTYTGTLYLSGEGTFTLNTNGVTLASSISIASKYADWSLGSAVTCTGITIYTGTFRTQNYALNTSASLGVLDPYTTSAGIYLGSSTIGCNGIGIGPSSIDPQVTPNIVFSAGTSNILFNVNSGAVYLFGGSNTFNNVSVTALNYTPYFIYGNNTFNNFTASGRTTAGITEYILSGNQTINGTLTLSAGTNATMRTFVRSDLIGTTRTLTCAAVSATDADFRDISIAGAAAPVSGTRLGDCKGNSGITFPAPKTVYWAAAANGNWGSGFWGFTNAGSPDPTAFPLAQDTIIFGSRLGSAGVVTVNANYNIGTIDMSARTSNTMTLATGSTTPVIHGNWINGTGTTLTGTGTLTFAGRGSQTITSAGKTFTQGFTINTPSGSVTLQDAYVNSQSSTTALVLTAGTLDANGYNVTLSGAASAFAGGGTSTRTVAIGSGTWTVAGSTWSTNPSTNCTVTGTGTISLNNTASKTFAGGSISYSGITLAQSEFGTLTITGNNTFKDIISNYSTQIGTSIYLDSTTQTLTQFTATGTSGKVLSILGTYGTGVGNIIITGPSGFNSDYVNFSNIRMYSTQGVNLTAGSNSTNRGSFGVVFTIAVFKALGNFLAFF